MNQIRSGLSYKMEGLQVNKIVTREEGLRKAAEQLDISPSKYKQAMERFESMKSYLLDGE